MHFISIIFLLISFSMFSQEWEQGTPLPQGTANRNHPITFSIGQYGYYLTGFDAFGNNTTLDDFYRFDSNTETWEQMEDFPGGARGFAYGVEHQGYGYVGFGLYYDGTSSFVYNDLWRFDPNDNSWEKLADCPCIGRRHPAMVAADGRIFVGLGDGPQGNSLANLKDWWEYDIETNSWRQLDDLPGLPRHHPYFFNIRNDVYVGLGHGTQQNEIGRFIYKSWFKWDTQTDTWTRMNDFPAEGRVAGTQFSHGGKGYVLSGQNEQHLNFAQGELFQYDPVEDDWIMLGSHPGESSRWAPGSFVIGDTLYFTSGRSGFGNNLTEYADLLKFQLPSTTQASVGGVDEIMDIYPNPAKETLYLDLKSENLEFNKLDLVQVTNLKGENIFTSTDYLTRIEVANYPEGTYFVTIKSGNRTQTKKFIIKR